MHVMMSSFLLTSACTSILLSPDAAIKQQIGRSKLMLYNKIYTGTPCAWGDDLRNHHLKGWIMAPQCCTPIRVAHLSDMQYLEFNTTLYTSRARLILDAIHDWRVVSKVTCTGRGPLGTLGPTNKRKKLQCRYANIKLNFLRLPCRCPSYIHTHHTNCHQAIGIERKWLLYIHLFQTQVLVYMTRS